MLTDATLQRDHSMLTFETDSLQGAAAITEKLTVCSPCGLLISVSETDADSVTDPSFPEGRSQGCDSRRPAL